MGCRPCSALFVLAILASSCTSRLSSLSSIQDQEQRILYRLARCRSKKCKKIEGTLKRRLERLRYQRAMSEGTAYALKRYLALYPKGGYKDEVQKRLSEVRFKRALKLNKAWVYGWYLLHHPEGKDASRAQHALEGLLAAELAKAPEMNGIKEFLRRFPRSEHRPAVLNLMAELRFREVEKSRDPIRLELFLRMFPRSPRKALVSSRLESIYRKRVEIIKDLRSYRAYAARYPKSVHLAGLRRKVTLKAMEEAVLDLDEKALARVGGMKGLSEAKEALLLLARIRSRPAEADRIRDLSLKTRPYRPRVRINTLLVAAEGESLRTARTAVRSLAFFPAMEALQTLVHILGAGQMGLGMVAWRSLKIWFESTPEPLKSTLTRDLVARLKEKVANPVDSLRLAAIMRAFDRSPARLGSWLSMARRSSQHKLIALLVEASGSSLRKAVRPQVAEELVERAGDHVHRLIKAFPATIVRTNATLALMTALHLSSVMEALSSIRTNLAALGILSGSVHRKMEALMQRAELAATDMDRRLRNADPDHVSVIENHVEKSRKEHEAGRAEAAAKLWSIRFALAEPVRRVLCKRLFLLPDPASRKRCKPRRQGQSRKKTRSPRLIK